MKEVIKEIKPYILFPLRLPAASIRIYLFHEEIENER